MAPKEDQAHKAAEIAIGSIGRGYDISSDIRLKFCKGDSINSRLIEIDEDDVREVVLPGGVSLPNVSKLIKCDKGERTRFRSDVLSFQQVKFHFVVGAVNSVVNMFYLNETFSCWVEICHESRVLSCVIIPV
jgi:hypothetical protein